MKNTSKLSRRPKSSLVNSLTSTHIHSTAQKEICFKMFLLCGFMGPSLRACKGNCPMRKGSTVGCKTKFQTRTGSFLDFNVTIPNLFQENLSEKAPAMGMSKFYALAAFRGASNCCKFESVSRKKVNKEHKWQIQRNIPRISKCFRKNILLLRAPYISNG